MFAWFGWVELCYMTCCRLLLGGKPDRLTCTTIMIRDNTAHCYHDDESFLVALNAFISMN